MLGEHSVRARTHASISVGLPGGGNLLYKINFASESVWKTQTCLDYEYIRII